jgi:cyclopropane fatty-acyl-phospholipid synthase-like methyltransferase
MSRSQKPYSQSCVDNAAPILEVLKRYLPAQGELLEIGSGTGQHAVLFAGLFTEIIWHTSDMLEQHPGIQMWLDEAHLLNLRTPLALDVINDSWPEQQFDAIYTANTAHIMPMEAVEGMFRGVASVLKADAPFLLYGPFMYHGQHTSESNQHFDLMLRSWEPAQGVRDVDWLEDVASRYGLILDEDLEMPANNRILIWRLGSPVRP